MYTVKDSFPHNGLIKAFSNYYNTLGMEPLDYDLCQPRKLSGLKGGWFEDKLWSQFWVHSVEKRIVNANIIRTEGPFEVIGDAVIVILHSNYSQLEDALDYYNLIHGSEHVQDSKEQGSSFFPFRTTGKHNNK